MKSYTWLAIFMFRMLTDGWPLYWIIVESGSTKMGIRYSTLQQELNYFISLSYLLFCNKILWNWNMSLNCRNILVNWELSQLIRFQLIAKKIFKYKFITQYKCPPNFFKRIHNLLSRSKGTTNILAFHLKIIICKRVFFIRNEATYTT